MHKYHPELRDTVSEMQQAVFDRGTEVGILARGLFPGGANPSPDLPLNFSHAIDDTRELVLKDFPVIYEAGFLHDDVHCFVDILVREEQGWHAYEVKSSTNLSNVYQLDAALQYYVMKNCSLELNGIDIILLNNEYVRNGNLDLQQLFSRHPVTRFAERLQPFVRDKIAELKAVLAGPEVPAIEIGPQCTDPYACDFMGHCWQHVPGDSVFDIAGLIGPKKWELYRKGILRMVDVPDDFSLNSSQKLQVEGVKRGKSVWKDQKIKDFIRSFHHPLYFLDFESFQSAIPLFDCSRPYQQIPFQYSLHCLEEEGGELKHAEYLAPAGPDPRPGFAGQLIRDLGKAGDIIVYNQAFEKQILKGISRDFPEYAAPLQKIISRIKDLMVPFRSKDIYLPEMKGSYSIKYILPALVPGYGYQGLEIADGSAASMAYQRMMNENDPLRRAEIRRQLLNYCEMDTLAMVRILEQLALRNSH